MNTSRISQQEGLLSAEFPRIISVDDHVVEPPDLWLNRLPNSYHDRIPHVIRRRLKFVGGTKGREWSDDPDGPWCDAWHYEDAVLPLQWLLAAVGREAVDVEATTYDEIHPGAWKQSERLQDMALDGLDASMCFPNVFRFAGQTFSERADKTLALLCIQAYNDWMIDDWGGGDGKGHLLPVTVVPLWDPVLAANEVFRCASKGSFNLSFPENPAPLGFCSLYTPHNYWEPLFKACEETETVLSMHIGSSSRSAHATPEAPYIVSSTQTFVNSQGSLLDFIFSGTLERYPRLKLSYAESQVGWLPYVLQRADALWEERTDNEFGTWIPQKPSEYLRDRVFFCMFDDEVGLRNRDLIGMTQITYETDYPHADSTFPDTCETFDRICAAAGLDAQERYLLARGNAIRAYGLERFGIRN
jgi:predicted TIM-barrel fold metal-dependent hydrolase